MKGRIRRPAQTRLFFWLFAFAWAGGSIAYVPFLTILLPLRVLAMAGPSSVMVLGLITFFGAVAASIGNIVFGWLSDRSGYRRPWVAAGLILNLSLLLAVPLGRGPWAILAIVVCWQLALNMMLGPLSAWAADRVPAHMTGYLGGMMALSPALGAFSGAIATIPGLANAGQRLWLVAAMVAACVVPLLVFAPRVSQQQEDGAEREAVRRPVRIAVIMWLARLMIQIAEATLFAYLFLYFRSLDPGVADSRIARLFSGVVAAAVPIAILVGRRADSLRRPARPLAICASISGLGLVAMAAARSIAAATFAYVGFGLATIVFLSLHSGLTMRVLPNPAHRGRDLGIFNLTNTVPSLFMPWLTITVVPTRGFAVLFIVLAVLAFSSSMLLFRVKRLD